MLPWQKKRKEAEEAKLAEEKAAKIKEMESVSTGVIDEKGQNEEVIEQAVEKKKDKPKEESAEPQAELDQIEVGIVNKHRADTQIELHKIELMTQQLEETKKTNELLEKLINSSV